MVFSISLAHERSLREKYFEAKDRGNLKDIERYKALLPPFVPSMTPSSHSLSTSASSSSSSSSSASSSSSSSSTSDPKTLEGTPPSRLSLEFESFAHKLLKVEGELRSIEKQPDESSQEKLDGLLTTLLDVEVSAPFLQRIIHTLKQELFFLYSLIETLQLSTPALPLGGKLILASFNQFARLETRSSCTSNVANFARHFLSLEHMKDIDEGWMEKITTEGMDIYITLLENRQKGFTEVTKNIAEETHKQKTLELQSHLSSLKDKEKEEFQRNIPLLIQEAVEAAIKSFWREQGGDHLAMGEVLSCIDFAPLCPIPPPPTHLLSQEVVLRKKYFQALLESLAKQADPKLTCSLTCNGYTYGLGIKTSISKTSYVIYDSHGNLALNASKNAFCIIYEELSSAAAYLASLVSYLDIPYPLQRPGTNRITYMVFVTDAPPTSVNLFPSLPPTMAFGKAAWEEHFGDIGEEPPLPANIEKILASPCPIWPDKQVKNTHILTLIPAKVNGQSLTLESLGELVQKPKKGHETRYHAFHPHGNQGAHVKENTWVLMTREPLPDSQKQSYDKQLILLKELSTRAGATYVVPCLIEAAVSLFVHYIKHGERLHGGHPLLSYTRCQEKTEQNAALMTVGHFISSGLFIGYDLLYDGVSPLRKFPVSLQSSKENKCIFKKDLLKEYKAFPSPKPSTSPSLPSWEVLTSIAQAFDVPLPEKQETETMCTLQRDCFQTVYQNCRQGEWRKITLHKELLPFITNPSGQTLLTCAVEERELEILKPLLHLTIPFSEADGRTPLHVAARNGFLKALPLLIPSFPLNGLSKEGTTPLHEAVLGDQKEAIDFLVKAGASITTLGIYEEVSFSPPALAAYLGLLDCFDAFALTAPLDFTQGNAKGTFLHLAILSREFDMLKHLLNHYSTYTLPLLKRPDPEGRTPSALAAFLGIKEHVDFLQAKERSFLSTSTQPPLSPAKGGEQSLLEELASSIKNNEHKKAIQTLHFLLLVLSEKPTTATLSTLYEALQSLLPHFPWTEKEKLYQIVAKLGVHPFSAESQARLMADVGGWHLLHKELFSSAERLECSYLLAAHYYAQSITLAPPLARKRFHEEASTLFQHLFEDFFPLYQAFTKEALSSSHYLLLEQILGALNHFVDTFSLPLLLQKKYLSSLNEQIREFLLLPSSQKAPNHSTLLTLAKTLSPHPPSTTYTYPTERLSASYQTLSLESSTQRFILSFQKNYLKDIEALNPAFTLSYDWRLEGERGMGCALPFAPLTTSLLISDPSALTILKYRESLLKLLFILSGAHILDFPCVTLKPPPFEIFSITVIISSQQPSSKTPSLLPHPPEISLELPYFSKDEHLRALKTLARKTYATLRLPLWQEALVQVEANYRTPLHHLIYALAALYSIPPEHPQHLVEELCTKGVFTKESADLVKQTLLDLHTICSHLHLHYKRYKSSAILHPYTLSGTTALTAEETRQLHICYFLVLKPLSYLLKQEKEPSSINLPQAVIEELWWIEEQERGLGILIPLLVSYLHRQKASFQIHQAFYQKLSARLPLDPLRSLYYDTLHSLDPSMAVPLAAIPNRKGVRLSQQLDFQQLTGSLSIFTTTTPPPTEKHVAIKGGGFSKTRYLKPELFSQLIDKEGNIIKQYKDSLHSVCRLQHQGYDLHFKQKPSQPMMEYGVYSLTKRIVGEGASPSTLLRFDVKTSKGIKTYPVLVSITIPGTNLKTRLAQNPKCIPDPTSFTLLALSQLLTRPGDGRASNYIITKENNLVCVDNDISFVEPITQQEDLFEEVHFCSILFCLHGARLDPMAIDTFMQTDPDLLLKDWLDELALKEKEYQGLFSSAEEERLYNEDKENRFTPTLLLRSGAITNLYTQYLHLKHHLKKRKPALAVDLLELFITFTGQNFTTQTLGPRIAKQYKTPQDLFPEQRLKRATERRLEASMTTRQHFGASLGKTPTAKEIEKREKFSLEKTTQEFLAYSLLRQEHVQVTKQKGNISLAVDFSHYTQNKEPDIERQSLVLDGLRMLFAMQDPVPTAITFTNCLALSPEKLAAFLHGQLTYLNIRGSGLAYLPDELDTAAPNLEELYLSDSLRLQNVQRNWMFSSEAFKLPHLKVLHMARCPRLTSAKVEALLIDLKVNHSPSLQLLECNVTKDTNVADCPRLRWKGIQPPFGKGAWEKYFGNIGEEPPLPDNIEEILRSPCPIWSGKKVGETHLLTLIPAKVNGELLTLASVGELVKKPKQGDPTRYQYFYSGGNENSHVERNTWILMTYDVLPGSRSQPYEKQVAMVEELAKKAKAPYELPHLIEASVALFMHYVRSGECLYRGIPWTYTLCQDKNKGNGRPMAIGRFANLGIFVNGNLYASNRTGVGAMRKL